jgi:hypothetical protein
VQLFRGSIKSEAQLKNLLISKEYDELEFQIALLTLDMSKFEKRHFLL